MAIRERPGRASRYQVYWNNPITGKRESISFATLHEAKKHDSLIKHRLEFERESFRPDNYEEETEGISVETLCYLYIKDRRLTTSNASKMLSAIDPLLQDIGHMDINGLTKQVIMSCMQKHLDSYVRSPKRKGTSSSSPLQPQKIKPITVKNRFGILKSALNWAEEQGFIEHVPKFSTQKPKPERIPPPTRAEAQAIFEVSAPHVQRAIILGLSFGMRIGPSELFKVTWKDVDFNSNILRIWSANKNKDMPWRDVPIREELLPLFKEWIMEDTQLGVTHLIHYDGKPIRTGFGKAWRAALKRANITRRIRPYDLRHAFATEALEGGADIGGLAEIMGHSDKTMILTTYQHVREELKKQVVSSLPKPLTCAQEYVPKQERD